MDRFKLRICAASLLFLSTGPAPGRADSPPILLSGRVAGAEGAGLPGARILLRPLGGPGCGAKTLASTVCAADGTFHLKVPPSGRPLKVVAEAPGWVAQEIRLAALREMTELPPVRLQQTEGPESPRPRPGSPPVWKTAVRIALGRVLNRAEEPVPGAKVTLRAAGQPVAASVSGRDGCFEIQHPAAGVYELTARGRGYARLSVPGLTISAESLVTDLGTVLLAPGVIVEGRVVDHSGEPVRDAAVHLLAAKTAGEPDEATPPVASGLDGFFRIEDLRPGEVVDLEARHDGYAPAAAPHLRVPPERPVRLVLQPVGAVEGKAVDPDGMPVAGAQITAVPADPAATIEAKQARSSPDGTFRIGDVAPGIIDLRATASGRQEARLRNLRIRPGQGLQDVEVVLSPAATIAGRVLTSAGRPVADAEVSLAETDGTPGPGARTDGEGRYRLDGVAPGAHTVRAVHRRYRPAARPIVVRIGDTLLDLTLETGASVHGKVVDENGGPVADARVVLGPAAGLDPREVAAERSAMDGTFVLDGLADGTYRLGTARGGSPVRSTREVTVAGGPVTGVEIVLPRGGAVAGRLLGLDFPELAQVQVRTDGGPYGQVRPDGSYRIDGVEPGPRQVVATLPGGSRQAAGQVDVEPGATEVRLDLDFGHGLTLTGRVVRNGEALPGAGVLLSAQGGAGRWGTTDVDGRFRFEGLDADRYDLAVLGRRGEKQHGEPVDLAADRDLKIEIRSGSISGRVVDAGDRSPIANARVTLDADAASETTTDSRGAFLLRDVPTGSWKVRALQADFAPAEAEVRVPAETPVEGVELALKATEGLTLRVLLSSGQPPAVVRAAVLDGRGRTVGSAAYRTGEDGKVRIPGVVPGAWELLLDAEGAAPLSLSVTAPGDAGRVVLPPPAGLELTVPALAAVPERARLQLNDAAGRLFRLLAGDQPFSEIFLDAGAARVERIAPGPWKLTVTAADGRVWTGTAFLIPGGVARVTLQ